MARNNNLTSNYIKELFAASFHKRTIFDTVRQYLKFSFLQTEAEKQLWQWTTKEFDRRGRIPTIGQMQQQFSESGKVLDLIAEINEVEFEDDEGFETSLMNTFENFIKKMKFLEVNDKIADIYNRGEKDKAYDTFVKYAEEFAKFSIMEPQFETVFGDFAARQARRKSEDYQKRFKIPTGIDELDYRLGGEFGGPETGECVLWLGDSGAGKSQCLTAMGIAAARQGHRTAHFQLEGTKEQCLNRYDAAWTGTLYQDVKLGNIPDKKMEVTKRIVKKLHKSDIIVISEEEWGGKSLNDIRRELKEIEKIYGKVDVIVIDYLELVEVGDGIRYSPSEERFRQAKLAKGMKTLAMEFNAVVHTATQSSSIDEEKRNDPEFVITRAQLSEDKGKIRPFDVFITINQTRDEMKDETMRLHTDKLRDYKRGDPIHIANNFAYSRFYDRVRTLNMDWDEKDED
jgi:hypothetical protein